MDLKHPQVDKRGDARGSEIDHRACHDLVDLVAKSEDREEQANKGTDYGSGDWPCDRNPKDA